MINQSSINSDAGLGTWSQATLYIALVVSCIFVPSWMIKTFGCKWTMVVSQLCYSVYFGVQLNPSFASLIPGAFVLGLAAAPNVSQIKTTSTILILTTKKMFSFTVGCKMHLSDKGRLSYLRCKNR